MANRYDQYVGTNYVPLPFDDILKAGVSKQQRYNDNLQAEEESDLLFRSVNAIQQHEGEKQALLKRYTDQLQTISNETTDKSDYDYRIKLKRLANQFKNDPTRLALEQTYTNAKLYQDDTIKLGDKADPDVYNPFRDYLKSGSTDKGYNFRDEAGNLKPFTYSGQKQKQDYTKRMTDMIGKIREDGYDIERLTSVDKYGNIVWTTEGAKGVSVDKAKQLVNNQVDLFLSTPEGGYYMDRLVGQSLPRYETLPKEFKDKIRARAAQDMLSLALPQTGKETKRSYDYQQGSEWQQAAQQAELDGPDNMQAVAPVDDVDKGVNLFNQAMVPAPFKQLYEFFTKDTGTGKLTPEQERLYAKAEEATGIYSAKGAKRKEVLDEYLKYKKQESVNPKINPYTTKQAEAYNRQYFGVDEKGSAFIHNKPLRKIAGAGNDEINGTNLMEKYGDKEKYSINVSGELTPDNPWFASGQEVVVTNKAGNEVARYAVRGNNDKTNQYQTLHDMYQSKYKVSGETTVYLGDVLNPQSKTVKPYIVSYSPVYATTPRQGDKPVIVGEKAQLLYADGTPVANASVQVQRGEDAIFKLYDYLTDEYFSSKK